MKQTGEIRLRIPQELIARLDHEKPKVLSLTSFCALLIEQGIDKFDRGAKVLVSPAAGPPQGSLRPLTGNKPSLKQPEGESKALQEQELPPQPTEDVLSSAQEPDHKKNLINVKNQKKARKTRAKATKGSPEFEAFWKRYQACEHLVQSQPKGAALEQWDQIVPDEVSADDLMRAIEAADQDSQRRSTPDWEQRLPMCSKWLKDGYYCTYLEEKQPQERKPSWML
jgi:hypothetical protein